MSTPATTAPVSAWERLQSLATAVDTVADKTRAVLASPDCLVTPTPAFHRYRSQMSQVVYREGFGSGRFDDILQETEVRIVFCGFNVPMAKQMIQDAARQLFDAAEMVHNGAPFATNVLSVAVTTLYCGIDLVDLAKPTLGPIELIVDHVLPIKDLSAFDVRQLGAAVLDLYNALCQISV